MWERFTEYAKHVVTAAREEAMSLGSEYVRTEHLLLAVCREHRSIAARVLEDLGVDIESLAAEVEGQVGRGEFSASSDQLAFTPRSKKVLEVAVEEARREQDGYIGSEHILLGLVQDAESPAAQALAKLGVSYEAGMQAINSLRKNAPHGDSMEIRNAKGLLGHLYFTERFKQLLERAFGEAKSQGKAHIHIEHILTAIGTDPDCAAGQVLRNLGVDFSALNAIAERSQTNPKALPPKRWAPFAGDSFQIFSYAVEEAEEEGRKHLGTEHVLLGLLRFTESGIPEELGKLGIDHESISAILYEEDPNPLNSRDPEPDS